jgi:hypothetical protein
VNTLKTLTFIWYDEYGFMPFNDIVYMNAAPAFKTASDNARRAHAPYGILITTTPGSPYRIRATIISYKIIDVLQYIDIILIIL